METLLLSGNSKSTMKLLFEIAQKLGIMGRTILVASGDDGANSPRAARNPAKCGYDADFPASSPWSTAVGATSVSELLRNPKPNRLGLIFSRFYFHSHFSGRRNGHS